MVWLVFAVAYSFAALLYFRYDTVTLTSVPTNITIYTMVFVATMVAALIRGRNHKETLAFSLLFVANFTFGWIAWLNAGGYHQAVMAHGILHLGIAVVILHLTTSKVGAVVSLLFCMNFVLAAVELLGMMPARPSGVFTGLHYPDLMSYTSMLAMVIFGFSCNDGGRRIMNWLNSSRGRANENYNGLGAGSGLVGAGRGRRRTAVFYRSNSDTPIGRDSWHSGMVDRENQ